MLKIKCFIFNPVAENTYIVWDDESLECAVIDAGCYSTEEKKELQEQIKDNMVAFFSAPLRCSCLLYTSPSPLDRG